MSNSNARKAATLGMPHGTAVARLRKNVLFHLLKKHNENICARCDEFIESVDDLSLEHLQPWEGISSDLFWDLNNIAFSHMHCNRPHRNWGGARRKVLAPEGQSWCFSCDAFKAINDFDKHGRRWNGLSEECKICKGLRNALRDRRKLGDV